MYYYDLVCMTCSFLQGVSSFRFYPRYPCFSASLVVTSVSSIGWRSTRRHAVLFKLDVCAAIAAYACGAFAFADAPMGVRLQILACMSLMSASWALPRAGRVVHTCGHLLLSYCLLASPIPTHEVDDRRA